MTFKYNLNEEVRILGTSNEGLVVGRAEYTDGSPNSYLIRYVNTDDDLIKTWYSEEDISLSD